MKVVKRSRCPASRPRREPWALSPSAPVRPHLVLASAVLGSALVASPAAAQQPIVDINLSPAASELLAPLGITSLPELEELIQTEVAALYGLLDVQEFLRLSANAQTLVLSGAGADYASNPDSFFFGFGVNLAINAGDSDLDAVREIDVDRRVPVSAGAMLTLMVGYNFADQGAPWLTLSAHGLHFPLTVDQFDGEFTNLGVHAQFKLFQPKKDEDEGFKAVRWGGLDLTTGFNYARTTLELSDTYEAGTALSDSVDLDTFSMGTLELNQTAYRIPFEITSNVTFVEVLTAYAGFGLDIPLGDAGSTIDLQTDLEGIVGGEIIEAGTARLQVNDRVDADDLLPRFMLGVQVNVWILRVFTQLTVSTQDAAAGLAAGVRVII